MAYSDNIAAVFIFIWKLYGLYILAVLSEYALRVLWGAQYSGVCYICRNMLCAICNMGKEAGLI